MRQRISIGVVFYMRQQVRRVALRQRGICANPRIQVFAHLRKSQFNPSDTQRYLLFSTAVLTGKVHDGLIFVSISTAGNWFNGMFQPTLNCRCSIRLLPQKVLEASQKLYPIDLIRDQDRFSLTHHTNRSHKSRPRSVLPGLDEGNGTCSDFSVALLHKRANEAEF